MDVTIAGRMLAEVPLSSKVMKTAVIGALKTPANTPAMPASASMLGDVGIMGSNSGASPPKAPPSMTPRNRVGANRPPGVPTAKASPATRSLAAASQAIVSQANCRFSAASIAR